MNLVVNILEAVEYYTKIKLKLKKLGLIDDLLKKRELDINERNKILDNPFKIYIPYYRKKLRLIDQHLDELELKIYSIQREIQF